MQETAASEILVKKSASSAWSTWLLLQQKSYWEAQLRLHRWNSECCWNTLGRLREAIQRKMLGQFYFDVIIILHDNCTSHRFQVTSRMSNMDEKWCSIYYAVQSWYPQTQVLGPLMKSFGVGVNSCLCAFDADSFARSYDALVSHLDKCLSMGNQYYEK